MTKENNSKQTEALVIEIVDRAFMREYRYPEDEVRYASAKEFTIGGDTGRRYYWKVLESDRAEKALWLFEFDARQLEEQKELAFERVYLTIPAMAIAKTSGAMKVYCMIETPVETVRYPIPVVKISDNEGFMEIIDMIS